MWEITDAQKIGFSLATSGGLFLILGIMLFFDQALLAVGNFLFLSGLTLFIGPRQSFYFFSQKHRLLGTACFIGGILLVFLKWPFLGVVIETVGLLNLFGELFRFRVILRSLRQLPFVGTVLSMPYIRDVVDLLAGSRAPA